MLYKKVGGSSFLDNEFESRMVPYAKENPSIDDLEESLRELRVQVDSLASSLTFDLDNLQDTNYGVTENGNLSNSSHVSSWPTVVNGTSSGENIGGSPNIPKESEWFLNPIHLVKPLGNFPALKSLGLSTVSRSSVDRLTGLLGSQIASQDYVSSPVSPGDLAYRESFPVRLGAPHVIGVKSLLPPKMPVRSRSPNKTKVSIVRGRSQSLDRSRSFSPASKRTRWLRSRSQSPKPIWKPNSAKTNVCSEPPPHFGRPRSGGKATASNRQSRSRSYKPGAMLTRSYTPPKMKTRGELSHSWSPYSLPSTAVSAPTAQEISERFLQTLRDGGIESSLVEMSPYQQELSRLRLERLRVEEELLLELKRQQELERTRGPKPKWYEMKDSQFHYEARKNNELLRNSKDFQALYDYRQELATGSRDFQKQLKHTEMDSF
ncbi:uncharacterized protein LOC115456518 isoform X2 [Microcaecilia unicolor]|nr:uncharacterized protein LOC115456518 isoform X2 [Microcaecilia unicolor]XP_030041511.1 uncharacterized protein LOC115456518 isoform X2 [Microcaecilia unicolor]XP_030041512.1 uncharacterized protein LOC115456518 isoform X2 [Microcaecilia unicolor]